MSNGSTLKIAIAAGILVLGGIAAYLDVQLNRSQDKAAAVTAERDQAAATVTQLNAKVGELQATTEQLSAANARETMPELPVSVSFHKALLGGRSYVADFGSHGSADMRVAVDWVNSATHSHRSFHVDVAPGRRSPPLGHLQGFDFEPGDTLTMTHDGFKPVVAQVP